MMKEVGNDEGRGGGEQPSLRCGRTEECPEEEYHPYIAVMDSNSPPAPLDFPRSEPKSEAKEATQKLDRKGKPDPEQNEKKHA